MKNEILEFLNRHNGGKTAEIAEALAVTDYSLPSNRRLLYQSTHVSVASSTSARFFQLLRCITSAL